MGCANSGVRARCSAFPRSALRASLDGALRALGEGLGPSTRSHSGASPSGASPSGAKNVYLGSFLAITRKLLSLGEKLTRQKTLEIRF